MTARGEIDQSEAVVALRDLLAATERHVFGDECLEERDAARRALTAPPSRGAPGPTAMFHLAVATLERGAAIDQLTDDEIAVIVSAVLAGIENNRAHTDTKRVAELEAALEDIQKRGMNERIGDIDFRYTTERRARNALARALPATDGCRDER